MPENAVQQLKEALDWFTNMIKPTGYAASTPHVTLADLTFMATISTLKAMGNIDLTPYEEINDWYGRVKRQVPNFNRSCQSGADAFASYVANLDEQRSAILEIYGMKESTPCRVVYMVCEMAGVPYKEVLIDIRKGDTMRPDFLKVLTGRPTISSKCILQK
jgi:glutathione S-transferase